MSGICRCSYVKFALVPLIRCRDLLGLPLQFNHMAVKSAP